jgi:hypothetical protein
MPVALILRDIGTSRCFMRWLPWEVMDLLRTGYVVRGLEGCAP